MKKGLVRIFCHNHEILKNIKKHYLNLKKKNRIINIRNWVFDNFFFIGTVKNQMKCTYFFPFLLLDFTRHEVSRRAATENVKKKPNWISKYILYRIIAQFIEIHDNLKWMQWLFWFVVRIVLIKYFCKISKKINEWEIMMVLKLCTLAA